MAKKTISEAVKQYKEKHSEKEEVRQISLFDLYEIEDIIIKVRKK